MNNRNTCNSCAPHTNDNNAANNHNTCATHTAGEARLAPTAVGSITACHGAPLQSRQGREPLTLQITSY